MRKVAIHIGCSEFEIEAYRGSPPSDAVVAAELDASGMAALTSAAGFEVSLLGSADATREGVIGSLRRARDGLHRGDLLVLTFSGHGAEHSDALYTTPAARPVGAVNRYPLDEKDGYDQSWCLRDGVLIDDDLHDLLAAFEAGVQLLGISDSCFSGDIFHDLDLAAITKTDVSKDPLRHDDRDGVRGQVPDRPRRPPIKASVLLSAAATPAGLAGTSESHGLFTRALLNVWADGRFLGDHDAFHAAVHAAVGTEHPPPLKRYGHDDFDFRRARPFGASGPARAPRAQRLERR